MPTSEVILTENIRGLGAEADIVKVKRGYARNFLLPTGKAYEVTPVTLRRINQLRSKRAEREAREHNEAQELARRINKLTLNLTLETGTTGKAFGSITVKDLEDALRKELGDKAEGIERHAIQLERPIKENRDPRSSRQAALRRDRDPEGQRQVGQRGSSRRSRCSRRSRDREKSAKKKA